MNLRTTLILLAALATLAVAQPPQPDTLAGRPRVIVLSDIGNEPDDQMSLVRFLLYSNQFDVEALIATTSTWQRKAVRPEIMHTVIEAFGKVQPNLLKHGTGWLTGPELDAKVSSGQPAYGLASTGPDQASEGATAILRAVDRDDPRPLWITIWGGANTLAQALLQLRATRPQDVDKIVARLRVYSISDQDDAGPWIRREFPALHYIVQPTSPNSGEYYYATWTGISGDVYYRNGLGANTTIVTNEWLDTNIRSKGPLGKAYPKFMFIMEGDTPSFLGLIDNGLNAFRRADWGGWGGRYIYRQPYGETHPIWTQGGDMFGRVTSQDQVGEHISDQATIWRWREAFQNDFAARMDWTIQDYAHANHNPVVEVNGQSGTAPIQMEAKVGEPITLDASKTTDPDKGQTLKFNWFHYQEAGSVGSNMAAVNLSGSPSEPRPSRSGAALGAMVTVTPTAVCRPQWLPGRERCEGTGKAHIILAVTDNGMPALTSYRRIIFTVRAAK